MVKLFDKPIRVNKSQTDRKTAHEIGANLFVGNLDPEVDEKLLYDTFSAFGMVTTTPKIVRDPDTGMPKGFGFVSFQTFESADAAIDAMDGQFLCNRPISVNYAFKKDGKGERHGTPAERLLAEKNAVAVGGSGRSGGQRPHTMFAAAPGQVHVGPPGMGMGGGMGRGMGRGRGMGMGMGGPPPPMHHPHGGPFMPPPPPHMMMNMGGHMGGMPMPPMPPPPGPPGYMPPPPPYMGGGGHMGGMGMPPPPPGMMQQGRGRGMHMPPPPPGQMDAQPQPPPPPPPPM